MSKEVKYGLRDEEIFAEWEAAGISPQRVFEAIVREVRRRVKHEETVILSMREFGQVVRRAAREGHHLDA